MQQDKISIDLKLPTKWEDLSDKQLRYVFALLVECREGACSHLCRGAAGVALATPPWQQRRHRQNKRREQREHRRACSRYAESRPRKTESTSATPQVVQPKVLRLSDEHQRVLRGQHRTLVHGHFERSRTA